MSGMYPSFNSGQRWEELVSQNAEHFPLLGVNTLIGIEKQNNIGNLGSVILQSWIKKAKPIKLKKKKKNVFHLTCFISIARANVRQKGDVFCRFL